MKEKKRILTFMTAAALVCASLPLTARADGAKVVTIGADLTQEEKQSMYEYFGTTANAVDTIEVTNADERKYMEGIASEAQIGTRTYSCSFVQPTSSGGIQVKTANLTFVTSSMIASTLLTSGVENCNVVAAAPFEVSGTGALTGIMMAYEKASGKTLSEEQKAAATEELVATGALADAVGKEDAANLMNEVKQEVLENGLTDEGEIQEAIQNAARNYNLTLTEDQMAQIGALMKNISQYDYDVKALKKTLENLEGKAGSDGFFSNLWTSVKSIFTGGGSADSGILGETRDELLGENAVIDSTLDSMNESVGGNGGGFWDKVASFFQELFGGSDEGAADDEEAGIESQSAGDASSESEAGADGKNGLADSSGDVGANPDGTGLDADGTNLDADGTDLDADGTDPDGANLDIDSKGASLSDTVDADTSSQSGAAETDGSLSGID